MYDIFISYSSKDKEKAIELAELLKEKGVSVWLDKWEIKAGDSIYEKIRHGINSSTLIALILSNDIDTDRLEKEVSFVSDSGQIFIPILAEKISPESVFYNLNSIDFSSPELKKDAIDKLIGLLAIHNNSKTNNILRTNTLSSLLSAKNNKPYSNKIPVNISSAGKTVIFSSMFTSFKQSPINIKIGDPTLLKVTLKFKDDKTNEQKIIGDSPNKSTLTLILINFNQPEVTGTIRPLKIGTLSGKNIYIHIRVFNTRDSLDKTINCTIYQDSIEGDDYE